MLIYILRVIYNKLFLLLMELFYEKDILLVRLVLYTHLIFYQQHTVLLLIISVLILGRQVNYSLIRLLLLRQWRVLYNCLI